jgi:hypothetical protein
VQPLESFLHLRAYFLDFCSRVERYFRRYVRQFTGSFRNFRYLANRFRCIR